MKDRWTHSNKATFNINFHLIWCTKYRRNVILSPIDSRLKEIINNIVTSLDCNIKSLEIMPDHVHILISTSPVHSPHYIVQQLKGKSSNILRKEFPNLKSRLPTLWTRSYYCESVGSSSEENIQNYIKNQKNK